MTVSKADRAILKAIAAVLPTLTDHDEVRALADQIGRIPDSGNAELGNCLWLAQWAVGDIGQSEDNELQDDIDLALQAVNGVLDYRTPREPKPRPATPPMSIVDYIPNADGTGGRYVAWN